MEIVKHVLLNKEVLQSGGLVHDSWSDAIWLFFYRRYVFELVVVRTYCRGYFPRGLARNSRKILRKLSPTLDLKRMIFNLVVLARLHLN